MAKCDRWVNMIEDLARDFQRCTPQSWLGWLGGIVDGEGTVGAWKRRRTDAACRFPGHITGVRIANTDPRLIQKVVTICAPLGGNSGYVQERRGTSRQSKSYFWSLNAYRAAALLIAVRPFLVSKGEQADLVIELQGRISARCGYNLILEPSTVGGVVAKGSSLSVEESELRESLVARIKALNVKGPEREEVFRCLSLSGG